MATPNISQITKMLREPQSITDADVEDIATLVQTYPYFTPGHYFEAARKQRHEPFSPGLMNNMQLYMGNWLQFHGYLQNVSGITEEVDDIVVAESATLPPEPVTLQTKDEQIIAEENETMQEEPLIQPIYTEDYFLHQGVEVSSDMPDADELHQQTEEEKEKSLMVVMSFAEWLTHFKTKSQKEKEEEQDQKALKTMWQKEKLAAAMEEENEEIPEDVFEMAVNSITQEEGLVSESLAEIHVKQGKYDKAIDMYRKLSLRNPQKNAYFARRIEEILKEKQS
jgi:tetratricopeptide (TPR) repeat protein